MNTKCCLLFAVLLLGSPLADAMFRDLPWVIRNLFPSETTQFYNSISEQDEKTLLKVFIMSRGDAERADQLVSQIDPILYKSYAQVFPAYYAKLNGLSPETFKFYKITVLDKTKALIRSSSTQYDFFKHFAVINQEYEKLSETSKAELGRTFPNVKEYLESDAFKLRAKLGADYD